MIIFSHSSVLSCPDKSDIKEVHIVFKNEGPDYNELTSLLLKFSLTPVSFNKLKMSQLIRS